MTYEEFQKALAYFDSVSTPFPDLEYELKIRKIFQDAGEKVFMRLQDEKNLNNLIALCKPKREI